MEDIYPWNISPFLGVGLCASRPSVVWEESCARSHQKIISDLGADTSGGVRKMPRSRGVVNNSSYMFQGTGAARPC